MRRDDLESALGDLLRPGGLILREVRPAASVSDALTEAWRSEKFGIKGEDDLEGVVALDLVVTREGGTDSTIPVIVKIRGDVGLTTHTLPLWLHRAGARLQRPWPDYKTTAEFANGAARETAVYLLAQPFDGLRRFLPAFIGSSVSKGTNLLVIERITDAVLMDATADVVDWTGDRILALIDALGEIHATAILHPGVLTAGPWPSCVDGDAVEGDADLFVTLLECGRKNLPDLVTPQIERQWSGLLDTITEWYRPKDGLLRTLVHNDFNPRNVCFRSDGTPLAYDWEVALIDIPQRDLVELLTFTLPPDVEVSAVSRLSEAHRRRLEALTGLPIAPDAWNEGVRIQLRYEAVNRVAWQWLFATQAHAPFVERITGTVSHLLRRMT